MKKFTLDWYKELGWRANPFEDKVLKPIEFFLTGYDEERHKINYFIIEKEPYGTISAAEGLGKTALLQWIISEMKRYRSRASALYFRGSELDALTFVDTLCHSVLSRSETVGMKTFFGLRLDRAAAYLKERYGVGKALEENYYNNLRNKNYSDFMKLKVFLHPRLSERGVLFLIDDCGELPEKTIALIRELYANKLPLQVILAGTEEEIAIGKHFGVKDTLKIVLSPQKYAQARDIVKKRIAAVGGEDIWPMDDTILSDFWHKANNNPRNLLKICYDYCVKQALKGVKPLKTKKEEHIVFDREPGFEMPPDVKGAEERGELPPHIPLEAEKETLPTEEERGSEYQIRVKDHSSDSIMMDSSEEKTSGKYRIREVHKEHTSAKPKHKKK